MRNELTINRCKGKEADDLIEKWGFERTYLNSICTMGCGLGANPTKHS
jgi:hypothetical protein